MLCLFAKDSKVYLHDWQKKKISQEIYLREKIDKYCIDQFDDLENRVLDEEYSVEIALFHSTLR